MNSLKGISLLALLAVIGGCASTSKQTSDGEKVSKLYGTDIIDAKLGICGNLVPDDVVTKNLGTSSQQTPKEKFELKQNAVKHWEKKVKEKNSLFPSNELYSFTIYTAYTQKSKEDNKLRLNTEDTADWSNGTVIDLAIPERVLFSASEAPIHPYDLTYPKYSVRNSGNDHRDSSQILSLLADYYGDQKSGSSKTIYSHSQHTNNWNLISKGEKTIFHGNETTLGEIPKTIGIFIDIPKWYEDEKSAIHKDEKGFYLALDEVSYDEDYFNYEDNYIHYLPVEYIFSLDNQCSNGAVSATIKQIIVRPDREGYLFTQQKPLTELKYN